MSVPQRARPAWLWWVCSLAWTRLLVPLSPALSLRVSLRVWLLLKTKPRKTEARRSFPTTAVSDARQRKRTERVGLMSRTAAMVLLDRKRRRSATGSSGSDAESAAPSQQTARAQAAVAVAVKDAAPTRSGHTGVLTAATGGLAAAAPGPQTGPSIEPAAAAAAAAATAAAAAAAAEPAEPAPLRFWRQTTSAVQDGDRISVGDLVVVRGHDQAAYCAVVCALFDDGHGARSMRHPVTCFGHTLTLPRAR